MSQTLEQITTVLQTGNMPEVIKLTNEAVEQGSSSQQILDSLLEGMSIIGAKFQKNEVFVPEVLIAARAMNAGIDVIRPMLEAEGVESVGKVVIGTIKGDLHDIGKNLVSMMMTGAGFDVIDLGVDCGPEKFIAAIEEHDADIVCMSALLTTTMTNMGTVIKALEDKGIRDKVKVMVGGAPLTEAFASEIGADKYTKDAASAAEAAKAFVA